MHERYPETLATRERSAPAGDVRLVQEAVTILAHVHAKYADPGFTLPGTDALWEEIITLLVAIAAYQVQRKPDPGVCASAGCTTRLHRRRGSGRPRKYCSTRCAKRASVARLTRVLNREERDHAPHDTQCAACGVEMPPRSMGYGARRKAKQGLPVYCTKVCSGKANAYKRWHPDTAVVSCG